VEDLMAAPRALTPEFIFDPPEALFSTSLFELLTVESLTVVLPLCGNAGTVLLNNISSANIKPFFISVSRWLLLYEKNSLSLV
jgi:hypothetical protein